MSSTQLKVAINGYGRIGRCVLRALHEANSKYNIQVVAINEPADLASMVYLSSYDSTHGVFPGHVEEGTDQIVINGQSIQVFHENKPEEIDWNALGIDMVLECSGQYNSRTEISRFIDSGCPRVLLSNPGSSAHDVDATIVFGINHSSINCDHKIVSAASCTTNASVPVLSMLNNRYGVQNAFLTTLHSVMNDQPLIDGYHHHDLRRTRSAMQSIVPVATGLAQGVERILPDLIGKVFAKAIRVPVHNVSAIDLTVQLKNSTDAQSINDFLVNSTRKLSGLISHSSRPHASIDFNHNSHSAIIDLGHTSVGNNGLVNLLVWFDNEWGFANRMLDVAQTWWQQVCKG